ncbi:Zn(2)-C6 fungal-type domain-containing protein [Fusarium falciforme]|uniref:Zn(2)-C6 fungal-type domain-containing protein n=1 Tax=Fusarium falciforme TaxID=195108 RepID=UPI0023003F21|nr:Zn(2)-C6 fungal-type domain-containing protein [Fusarium falciforme]WAO92349.1 Zn(2)-C6 fungal-type domain-containing protein [Fusarium falciforme]
MDTAYPYMRRKAKPNVAKTTTLPEPSHSPTPEQDVTATTQESPSLHFTHESIDTDIIPSDAVDVAQISDKALELYYELPISWELLLGGNDVLPLINIENQDDNGDNDDNDDWPKAAKSGPPWEAELFTSNDELIIPPSNPDHVPAWKRCLLLNYSDNIANEIIAVDGPHNGWRHLMLPIAETDELVMDAVLAVSLFHSSRILQNDRAIDQVKHDHYGRAIQGLQRRSQLRDCDRPNQQSILITILLLLTAVMVNGSSDFPILFGMLQSAIDVLGGEAELGSGDIAEFVVRQVRKFKVYAAPLLSEDAGINIISSETEITPMFDCLNHCLQNNPRHAGSLALVPNLVHQACEIYMNQAVLDTQTRATPQIRARHVIESIGRVQRFIDTLEEFPDDAPGKQVLTWACFVAASDCRLAEHKEFFSNFFLNRYARSGFMNLTMGLDALGKIWTRKPDERWTVLLPHSKLFMM